MTWNWNFIGEELDENNEAQPSQQKIYESKAPETLDGKKEETNSTSCVMMMSLIQDKYFYSYLPYRPLLRRPLFRQKLIFCLRHLVPQITPKLAHMAH